MHLTTHNLLFKLMWGHLCLAVLQCLLNGCGSLLKVILIMFNAKCTWTLFLNSHMSWLDRKHPTNEKFTKLIIFCLYLGNCVNSMVKLPSVMSHRVMTTRMSLQDTQPDSSAYFFQSPCKYAQLKKVSVYVLISIVIIMIILLLSSLLL